MNSIARAMVLALWLSTGSVTATTVAVQKTGVISGNGADMVSVSCPAGMVALSGGIIPSNVFESEIAASGPLWGAVTLTSQNSGTTSAPNGWYGVVHSFANAPMNAIVVANCTTDSGITAEIKIVQVPAAASSSSPNFGGGSIVCPNGRAATGGGADSSDHLLVKLTGSSPLLSATLPGGFPAYNHADGTYGSPPGWNAFMRNQRNQPATMVMASICTPYTGLVTALHNFSIGETRLPTGAAGNVSCPTGKVALGGGIDFVNVLNGVTVYNLPSTAGTSPPAYTSRADGQYPLSAGWLGSFYSYVTTGFGAAVVAVCADVPQATATLFYNTGLNHYFMTSDPAEVTAIGNGVAGPGWTQLAEHFKVVERGNYAAGSADVCRFYGTPGRGPNSHFYTIDPAECAAVKQDPGWTYEAIAFRAINPSSPGVCPAGTVNVYRAYNNRFASNDSNHRYTTSTATMATMVEAGWKNEGTVFCAFATP